MNVILKTGTTTDMGSSNRISGTDSRSIFMDKSCHKSPQGDEFCESALL